MLSNLNKLDVRPGDAVLVPAGTAHAIGGGVFSVELQEPTDFSIMLEFAGFDLDPSGGELGLGRDLALSCVREKAFSARDLELLRREKPSAAPGLAGAPPAVQDVLPAAAAAYFRAQRVFGSRGGKLEPSFAVLIAVSGEGALSGEGWRVPLQAGSTFVVPWGAGPIQVDGDVELLRCLPPLPSDAATDDPTEGA
jgi:mannose-6-phosphate isomerase